MEDSSGALDLNLAFVSGLSDKKLAQKLPPLQALPEVSRIDLYRRQPFYGKKIRWIAMPLFCSCFAPCGDFWRFAALLKNARRYDVIIGCHQRFHGIYAAVAGILFSRPVIQLTINDLEWLCKGFLGEWALRHATAVGFRGNITRGRFRKMFGNKRPLFIPQNVWLSTKNELSPEKSMDLLYVGYLADYKNIPGWLETAAEVKRRRGHLKALVVGEKPNWHIRSLVDRLGLGKDIKFPGHLHGKDLETCYAEARILLLTSFWEGLPMVALEAMAAGVPVVATDVGDVRELVKDGQNGYLTPVGNVQHAATAVEKLLQNETLYHQMSQEAKKMAAHFLIESTLEQATGQWRKVFIKMGVI